MNMKILGMKSWELRVDDRGYCVGDFVHYVEVDEKGDEVVRQSHEKNLYRIDAILTHEDFHLIPEGCVIWSESEAASDPLSMRDAILGSME